MVSISKCDTSDATRGKPCFSPGMVGKARSIRSTQSDQLPDNLTRNRFGNERMPDAAQFWVRTNGASQHDHTNAEFGYLQRYVYPGFAIS